ncbi:FAD binding domain-containing protein [Streptomyces sp. KLOTTS4A1]|uniref:FAD binding domain-containing protein n=1 Tax=Streptomyces sp. KLOTTS4A1 TaxID=3390996 RepID=UPI0039F57C93
MILTDIDYVRPTTLDEAVALLAAEGSRPLAGGQSLLVDLRTGEAGASRLVDLDGLADLRGISRTASGRLRIGALTTLAELAAHPEIRTGAPALAEAAHSCGDPQVRNRGTVGGNLGAERTRPAGGPWTHATDLPPAVLALGASLLLAGPGGPDTRSADAFALDALPAGTLVTALELPLHSPRTRSAFAKTADRATRYPQCAVAVRATRAADGSLDELRIAVTGATARARRAEPAEERLRGTVPTTQTVLAAFRDLPGQWFVPGRGTSAEYLRHLAGVLAARALGRITAD